MSFSFYEGEKLLRASSRSASLFIYLFGAAKKTPAGCLLALINLNMVRFPTFSFPARSFSEGGSEFLLYFCPIGSYFPPNTPKYHFWPGFSIKNKATGASLDLPNKCLGGGQSR